MGRIQDTGYLENGDIGVSSSRNNKEKLHRAIKENTFNRNLDKYSSLGIYSSSSHGKLKKGLTLKARTIIYLTGDGINTINIMRRKANATNTVQRDVENMDYSALQHYTGPDCITKTDTLRSLSTNKQSPREVKPNTIKQPSSTYYPFTSPYNMLPSSSTNGILDQMINAPTDRINLDLSSDERTEVDIPKKIPIVANTAQNDRKNIDYSVTPTNKKENNKYY